MPSNFRNSFSESCQKTFTGGSGPRAGKSKRMTVLCGKVCLPTPSFLMHSTLVGPVSERRSAMFGVPMMWQAMSPMAPQPYSGNARQWCGAIAGEYGRSGEAASHACQSRCAGTGSGFGSTSGFCGQ